MTELDTETSLAAERYVVRHFIGYDALVERTGASENIVADLLTRGAAPGVIYVKTENRSWWSALGAYIGRNDPAPPDGECWYNPASVWHLRRALLHIAAGMSPSEAAESGRTRFIREFVDLLPAIEGAALAYPSCFNGAAIDSVESEAMALKEWDAWIRGAYGVCLRRFSAHSCIEKEALRALIVASLNDSAARLDDERVFDYVERLEALVMPFAPWERPGGTPGTAIDAPLAKLGLGKEDPYH